MPETASSARIIQRISLNSKYFPSSQCPNKNFAHRPNGHTPPLFLQELAHLSSLACAVALSTLRNDIEYSESPLDLFVAGAAWPPSDPDHLPKQTRREFQHYFHLITIARHWLGLDRYPDWRSKYNAARPLLVLGGVSNSEIQFLQMAKGPHAKAALALGWLKEFIIREHLEGSLGSEVHPAFISHVANHLSDGMMHYHQARKIMYIPFPFPHAQLSAFFSVVMIVAVPYLIQHITNVLWMGSFVTFLTVTGLVGLHEVSRELENPFRNVPNEIPLCTLQALYNETLVTMFSGYNPDSFWDAELYQGELDAMKATGKHEQQQQQSEAAEQQSNSKTETKSTIPDQVPARTESSGPAQKPHSASHISQSNKKKSVSFTTKVETDSEIANELRDIFAQQVLEIKELVKYLGEDAEEKEEEEWLDNYPIAYCG